jgi:hypothetical protein
MPTPTQWKNEPKRQIIPDKIGKYNTCRISYNMCRTQYGGQMPKTVWQNEIKNEIN